MTMLVKKGTFTTPSVTTTSFAVTGVGFQPKAVIFWASGATAEGYGSGFRQSLGVATGAANQWSLCSACRDADVSPQSNSSRLGETASCFLTTDYSAGTAEYSSALVSLDSDGFTLNVTVNSGGTGYIVHYIALAGTDITNAYAGTYVPSAGTGNKSVTGVGFQPDFVLQGGINSAFPASGAGTNFQIAAFTALGQGASSIRHRDVAYPTQNDSYQRTDKAWGSSQTGTDALDAEANFVSMDVGGFTLNYTTHNDSTLRVGFLALKGGKYWVGSDTQKTSTGTQAKTGVGFQPSALLLFGNNKAASTSLDLTQAKLSIGATDGTNKGCTWVDSLDNVSTVDANRVHLTTKLLRHATSPSTTNAEADLSSFDSDGYTLNWTTADGILREFISVAFGSTVSLDSCLPDADIVTTGWSTAPLFSKVNDASDATVITATAV